MGHDLKPIMDGCLEMGIELSEEQLTCFSKYIALLLEWNQKFNLTAITDPKDIQVQHFIDSISLLKLDVIKEESVLLDMGTGAGFPGIPLKIMLPKLKLTLVDSVQKKVGFLDEVIQELELKEVNTIHARAEDLAKDVKHREEYHVVVSRAVAELRVLAEYCLPFVKKGGYFISHKGPGATVEKEQAERAMKILGGKWIETRQIEIPFSEKTHNLIIVKKVENTPKQFPRKAGIPKKEPL